MKEVLAALSILIFQHVPEEIETTKSSVGDCSNFGNITASRDALQNWKMGEVHLAKLLTAYFFRLYGSESPIGIETQTPV